MVLHLAQRVPCGAGRAAQLEQELVEVALEDLAAAHAGPARIDPTAYVKRSHSRRSEAAAAWPAVLVR